MAQNTPLGFPFPEDSDYPSGADVPLAVQNLAEALDAFLTGQYRLVAIRYITSGVTYEPTAGVDALYVECVGGGGAGGGCNTGATNGAAGGGGGGGGYAAVWATTMKHPFTVAVGLGGVGASAANGGHGGDTTFDSPSICTGAGGTGGLKSDVGAVGSETVMGGQGSLGGQFSVGDAGFPGEPGDWGLCLAAAQVGGGAGGSSVFGAGGRGLINATSVGSGGAAYGGGGAGATIISGGVSRPGGDGGSGLIRVWEFQKTRTGSQA
jgi:hypothetical protein